MCPWHTRVRGLGICVEGEARGENARGVFSMHWFPFL